MNHSISLPERSSLHLWKGHSAVGSVSAQMKSPASCIAALAQIGLAAATTTAVENVMRLTHCGPVSGMLASRTPAGASGEKDGRIPRFSRLVNPKLASRSILKRELHDVKEGGSCLTSATVER